MSAGPGRTNRWWTTPDQAARDGHPHGAWVADRPHWRRAGPAASGECSSVRQGLYCRARRMGRRRPAPHPQRGVTMARRPRNVKQNASGSWSPRPWNAATKSSMTGFGSYPTAKLAGEKGSGGREGTARRDPHRLYRAHHPAMGRGSRRGARPDLAHAGVPATCRRARAAATAGSAGE
jgi:hypothetical protein